MLLYLVLFLLAFIPPPAAEAHAFRFIHLKNVTVSPRYAAVFLVFFALLIVLRIARLTLDAQELDVVTISVCRRLPCRHAPCLAAQETGPAAPMAQPPFLSPTACAGISSLSSAPFMSSTVYGIGEAAAYVFVPFVLGMGCSMAFASKLWRLAGKACPFTVQAAGACAGLVLLMTPFYFPAGVFLVSFFFSGTSSLLEPGVFIMRSPFPRTGGSSSKLPYRISEA